MQLGSYMRSIGKEDLGFWGFILCYYVIALPLGYLLGTIFYMNVIGMLVGIYCLCAFDIIVIWKTDLNKQISFINERINQSKLEWGKYHNQKIYNKG